MATDFLWDAGTNGFVVTPFDILSSETGLNAITYGSAITSTVGGSSGVFARSDIGGAPLGDVEVTINGSATPNAGGYLALWFLRSKDGGSTFETLRATPSSTVNALQRPPDLIVPLSNSAYSAGDLCWAVDAVLPPGSFKAVIQNLSGVTLNINHVKLAPKALQH
jgi:hypothetical protein